ncbi:MAG TPA: MGMT family protein [Myxococcota bacterium]|nr:MGMT family protein [Myxococcota bacterium]
MPENHLPAAPRPRPRAKRRLSARSTGTLSAYERIYRAVSRIPRGRVATYGQVAELAGVPGGARQVGYALAASGDARVPWHRVVNARGEISPRAEPCFEALQRQLLAREGVALDADGRLSLARFRWRPRGPLAGSPSKMRSHGSQGTR